MGQISIRFDDDKEQVLREAAAHQHLSLAQYMRCLVENSLQALDSRQQTPLMNALSEDKLLVLHKRTLQTSLEILYLTRFISSQIGQGGKEVDLKNFERAKNKALSVIETLFEQPDSVD